MGGAEGAEVRVGLEVRGGVLVRAVEDAGQGPGALLVEADRAVPGLVAERGDAPVELGEVRARESSVATTRLKFGASATVKQRRKVPRNCRGARRGEAKGGEMAASAEAP